MNRNHKSLLPEIASAALVVTLACLLRPGEAAFAAYWMVSFWLLAGLDFYQTQIIEDGRSEVAAYLTPAKVSAGTSFADRFFAYLFFAPFVAPARMYRLVAGR